MNNQDLLVSHGGALKATSDGMIAGLLVRFGSPETCDTDREFFTAKTDFGFDGRDEIETAILYHHGMDPQVGLARVGRGVCKMTADGVWFEGQLDLRKKYVGKYAKRMLQLARTKGEDGSPVLGASSGSLPHLVTYRDAAKGTREILTWPLGLDASLTPTPADCRTYVTAMKSAKPVPTLDELWERYAIKSAKADDDLDLSGDEAHKGLLVALYPSADTAAKLAIEGGEEASELHVTLTYSVDGAPYDEVTWCRVVTRLVDWLTVYVAPLPGTVGGVGRFSGTETSGGKDVFYASVDVPGLSGLREMLRDYMSAIGVRASAAHGFTPHMTLRYLEPGDAPPLDRLEPVPVTFDRLTVKLGDRRVDLPLLGTGTNERFKAAKGELDDALAEAAARQKYWDLRYAFDAKLEEIAKDAEGGADDTEKRVVELVADYGDKVLDYALAVAGVPGGNAAKSFKGDGPRDGRSLDAQTQAALDAVKGAVGRWRDVAALKVGRAMSGSRRDRASAIAKGLRDHADSLDAMVKECEPKQEGAAKSEARPRIDWHRFRAEIESAA